MTGPLLPLLSGILLGASYWTQGRLLPINLAAFVPILLWHDRHAAASRGARWRAGILFGFTAHLIALHWTWAMLEISWLASVMYVGLALAFAVVYSGTLVLAGWVRRRTGGAWAWVLPACWIPLEWARTWGDLRMTADHVGHTLAAVPFLVQFADVVGPYGVGAAVLAANGFAVGLLRPATRRRSAAGLALLAAAVLAYDAWAWVRPLPSSGTLRVAYVQPNIPLVQKWDPALDERTWAVLQEQTREAAAGGAEVVIWPETAYPRSLYHWLDRPETYALPDVSALARETGTTIVAGVEYTRIRKDAEEFYNAALVVGPDGTLSPEWVAKVYLVPFVEKVPYEPLLGPVLSGGSGETMRWLGGGFLPGPAAGLLTVAGARLGVQVCYEELYPDLARRLRNAGAGFQAVITNDAWFGRTFFQDYQANVLRMRAIENRTAIVRSANTGISGFVDPRGRYEARTGLFVPAVAVREIPLAAGRSPYARIGDAVVGVALAVLGAAVARGLARRGGRDESPGVGPVVGGVPGDGAGPDRPGAGPGGDAGGARPAGPGDGHDHPLGPR